MKIFLSKVWRFFKRPPSKRLSCEGVSFVVRVRGYESLIFELVDISDRGFSVRLRSFSEVERERFRERVEAGREFRFVFYFDRGLSISEVEIRARGVAYFEEGDRYAFRVVRDEARLRKIYEVAKRLKGEQSKAEGCGEGSEGVDRVDRVDPVQRLYYLSLLEEKRLAVREKRFKLSFLVLGLIFFILSGGMVNVVGTTYREMRLRERIESFEREHNAKVLFLVHRKRQVGLWGVPVYEYLEVFDAHRLLRELRDVDDNKKVVLIVHSPGGQLTAGLQIAKVLRERRGETIVVVPYYAMSAGTLIALAADEIYAGEGAVFGPIDPQVPGVNGELVPAVMVERAYRDVRQRDLRSAVVYQVSKSALRQMESFLREELLKDKDSKEREKIIKRLLWTEKPHDFPIFAEELKCLGIRVKVGIPQELRDIVFQVVQEPTFQAK